MFSTVRNALRMHGRRCVARLDTANVVGAREFASSALVDGSNAVVIFDKDGTLIDFQLMWGRWAEGIAWRLENSSGLPFSAQVREKIFDGLGYDWITRKVRAEGKLCCRPMAELKTIVNGILTDCGMEKDDAQRIMDEQWFLPDPKDDSRPLTNLRRTFKSLRGLGVSIAILTADSRKGTVESLHHLDIIDLVDTVVCGDDGLPAKPLPEAIWAICKSLGVKPENAIMVGDTGADMKVGQNARVALTVGVLGGASMPDDLAQDCDVLVPDVSKVPKLAYQLLQSSVEQPPHHDKMKTTAEYALMTSHRCEK